MRGWLAAAAALALAAGAAHAETFRWANDYDVRSLDPYAGQEAFLRSFDENIYEPLVRRGRALALEPGLAASWQQTAPDTWRFALRDTVVFQDGSPFTADDVVFSFARVLAPGSRLAPLLAALRDVRALDPRTVEIVTNGPDPLLPDELAAWPIMSRRWCEAHDAAEPADSAGTEDGYANDHADGTGPFMVEERVPGGRTVLVPNPRWWDRREDNLDRVVFTPVADRAALVRGLEQGALDMIYDVPPGDIDRLAHEPDLRVVEGPELGTNFLGFDQTHDTLRDSTVIGRNPFKDRRVREAFALAIDEGTIIAKVMRGHATPAGLLVAPGVDGYDAALDARPPYDPARARSLLAAAGFPGGFETGMDCPTDRYVNDEAICEEVVAMLAQIGVKVELLAQTRARFFDKLMPPKGWTSFYLMGWTPALLDAEDVLVNLAETRAGAALDGTFNFGGYSNPGLDALIGRVRTESDPMARRRLLSHALAIVKDDVAYLPLHRQNVVWAMRAGVTLVQRADTSFPLRFVRIAPARAGD
jgi:peptide/nickel transport system substrate-binding protein